MSTNINQPTATATTHSASFVERLADKMGSVARASTVYGEPVERDEVTIIPVARARWLVGGGGGRDNAESTGGSGGGGGMRVAPVGYIEIKEGHARYKPIFDPALIVQIILGSGLATALILRGVRKIIHDARF